MNIYVVEGRAAGCRVWAPIQTFIEGVGSVPETYYKRREAVYECRRLNDWQRNQPKVTCVYRVTKYGPVSK
jgi:hypothetical protein